MPRSTSSSAIPPQLTQPLRISSALARERLIEIHLRYALELVEYAKAHVEPARAVDMYSRLHGLQTADAEDLRHKVFVTLGRRSVQRVAAEQSEHPSADQTPRTILQLIRRRLRGRVNLELRGWVEYHTGRAETELLWAHVENALQFIDLLEPELDAGEAVTVYAAEMALSSAKSETIYYLALAHRSAGSQLSVSDNVGDRPSRGFGESSQPALRLTPNRPGVGRRHSR